MKPSDKLVVGLAGPGATGKETVGRELAWPKVINTTTREKRGYETHGVEYYFTDEPQFHKMAQGGDFLVHQERPGRGWYGIRRDEIVRVLSKNPATLKRLADAQEAEGAAMPVVYLLPPSPPLAHLIIRLSGRCLGAGDDLASTVTSTLGKRQVDEFLDTLEFIKDGKPFVYAVNDVAPEVANRIRSLLAA